MSPTKKKKQDTTPQYHRDASPVANPSLRGLENLRGQRGLDGPRR
jgi:hypothetical protein